MALQKRKYFSVPTFCFLACKKENYLFHWYIFFGTLLLQACVNNSLVSGNLALNSSSSFVIILILRLSIFVVVCCVLLASALDLNRKYLNVLFCYPQIDKIPKYGNKMMWLDFKILKYCHKTLWLVISSCVKFIVGFIVSFVYVFYAVFQRS